MPIAANQSFLGIAKEATPGTAAAATNFLPVTAMTPKIVAMYLPDDNMRGSNAKRYDQRLGVQYAEYDLAGALFPDTFGFLATGILGDVATTGAGPFVHAVSLQNAGQPQSYTISDYNGFNTRQFAGAKFSDVSIKFAGNGLLDYTAKAWASSFATTTKPASSFTAVPAVPAWTGVSTLLGSASSLIVSGDINIKRTVEVIHNVDGLATPYAIFGGGDLECTGSFMAVYEDDSIYSTYLNGTQQALDFTWTQGTAVVKVHMSTAQIIDAVVTRAGGKYVELSCKFEAVANTTDKGASGGYSPVAISLTNALPAGTYK